MNVFELLAQSVSDGVLKGRIVYHTPGSMQFSITNKLRTEAEFAKERLGGFVGFLFDHNLESIPTAGSIDFHVDSASEQRIELISLKRNGDIYVKGKLIENDKEVVDALREFVARANVTVGRDGESATHVITSDDPACRCGLHNTQHLCPCCRKPVGCQHCADGTCADCGEISDAKDEVTCEKEK